MKSNHPNQLSLQLLQKQPDEQGYILKGDTLQVG
jgi:hypothetical protein